MNVGTLVKLVSAAFFGLGSRLNSCSLSKINVLGNFMEMIFLLLFCGTRKKNMSVVVFCCIICYHQGNSAKMKTFHSDKGLNVDLHILLWWLIYLIDHVTDYLLCCYTFPPMQHALLF